MLVDMNDDRIDRFVILEDRYDAVRGERRNDPVAAYSTESERNAAMAARAREIQRSGSDDKPRSLTGAHWEPHYFRRVRRGRVRRDALKRGVIIAREDLSRLFP